MEIIQVNPTNDHLFYSYVQGRELEFFFFIMDYKQYPDKCQLFMALDEKHEIQGLMIIWREHTIQLRGNHDAIIAEIDFLIANKVQIHNVTGPYEFQNLLSKYFPKYKMRFVMNRLVLKSGSEKLYKQFNYQELNPDFKKDIANFLQKADPIYFGHHTPEDIIMDENRPFFAIMKENQIISIAGLWIDQMMGIINLIATDPEYRNQGYATSMVSASVKWLFQRTNQIIIHVRAANIPALHTYQKVGFQTKFIYDVITISQ